MRECEMCASVLHMTMRSASSSRPASPIPANDDDDEADSTPPRFPFIKLSFRKAGDKPFYALLKRALKSRAWEVSEDYLMAMNIDYCYECFVWL